MSLALDAMVFCEISSISFWDWWISLWVYRKNPLCWIQKSIGFHWRWQSGRRFQRLRCCSEFTPKGGVNICHYEHCFLLVLWVRRVFVATGFHWKRWEAIWKYFLKFRDDFDISELREVFLRWGKCCWKFQASWETFFDVSECFRNEWFQEFDFGMERFWKFQDGFNEFGTGWERFWNDLCDLKPLQHQMLYHRSPLCIGCV